jgi:hypothetical protein
MGTLTAWRAGCECDVRDPRRRNGFATRNPRAMCRQQYNRVPIGSQNLRSSGMAFPKKIAKRCWRTVTAPHYCVCGGKQNFKKGLHCPYGEHYYVRSHSGIGPAPSGFHCSFSEHPPCAKPWRRCLHGEWRLAPQKQKKGGGKF